MDFDPDKALTYARALARPRLVGSGEDERVAQEIVARLASFGYQVEREPFRFTRAFEIVLAGEIGLALALVCGGLLWSALSGLVGFSLIALLSLVSYINWVVHYHSVDIAGGGPLSAALTAFFLKFGRQYHASNVAARLARNKNARREKRPTLHLVAHLDSKSQRLPIVVRIILIVVFVVGLLVFSILSILRSVGGDVQAWVIVSGITTLVAGLPLLLLNVDNGSPGAIDNASGTGVVLHLAEVLAQRPELLDRVRLEILITSAEELSVMGALYHVRRHKEILSRAARQGGLYVMNFDGTGLNGQLYVAEHRFAPWLTPDTGHGLRSKLIRASAQLNIPLRRFLLPGALFDHMPFVDQGFAAATLVTVSNEARFVHTPQDTPDRLHPRGFELAGQVALKVMELIAAEAA